MKTAIERKNQTEAYLKKLGVPFIDHLPTIEEEQETEIRSAKEIAERILILTYMCYVGEQEEDKSNVVKFLKEKGIWNSASPDEKELLIRKYKLTHQEKIDISWKSEYIWLLL